MRILAAYFRDENFTHAFVGDTIYTIANNSGEWGRIRVGETTHWGMVLTKDCYEKLKKRANRYGTFELK